MRSLYRQVPDFSKYIANRIYNPSYISLQTALAFYDMIPETVNDGRSILFATPEKALLDLLYLNPYYRTSVHLSACCK